jgi:hypothetical protein
LPRSLCLGLALVLGALAAPGSARADDGLGPAELCERAILNGARRGGVPVEVLHAVALTETGKKQDGKLRAWPWAINREGKGYWFDSYEEALAFAKQSLADGRRSFDVGCVQINYRWHGHAFPSLDDMFDPEWTATYAAQFLRTLYEERGDWSAAAGAYHSLSPQFANVYRERFDRLLAGLDPTALTADETLLASAAPGDRRSTRGERRRADRLVTAARIRDAGPPPEPVMGSLAGVSAAPAGPGLLVGGAPMLSQAAPLLTAAAGSLF